jgi:hypothetical protein
VTRGRAFASSGKSHSCETPTTCFISPSAAAISVAAGKSETIRITLYCMQFPCTRTGKEPEQDKEEKKEGLAC